MPRVFLSPSTQEYNMYYDGSGSEEFYMNQLADLIEPNLTASGIEFTRNDPNQTVGGSVRQSNAGNYDFHLALHSNASGSANYGQQRGSDIYYYTNSSEGQFAAELIAEKFKDIYPNPEQVRALPITSLYELNNTIAPAVLVEVAYHDNTEDAEWIKGNLPEIAKALADATVEFLSGSITENTGQRTGTVTTQGGRLNIRSGPSLDENIIGQIPNGRTVNIISESGDWYRIRFNDIEGYVFGDYLREN